MNRDLKVSEQLLNWIRPEIRELSAYHVPDAAGLIKLDAMENPYRLPETLLSAWQQGLAEIALNRYPDPAASELQKRLTEAMQVPEGKSIVLGNGSDELIQMLALAVAAEGRCIMSFEPGFVMYSMIARFAGMSYVGVPLASDFTLDMAQTRAAIERHQPAVIFLAYPNNPTGNLFDAGAVEEIISLAPGLVVVDEAYHPFALSSFMSRLEAYDQLLVMRTVSKMGLAGLRLGLLCGNPALIEEINKVRLPYNINVLTQYTAGFVLENAGFLDGQAEMIRADRDHVYSQLALLEELEVFPSQANFILFRVKQGSATEVFAALRDQGVLIKNLDSPGPLQNCLRVTVGTPEENQAFMQALEQALRS
ncbi:MAG: histidinol-phosphate transaminase [Thiotrichales bacterium]|nr:MAG: histidinol-phosphate transaminase [Thiotrichales bacterium]